MKTTGLVLVALLVGLLGFLPLGNVLFSGSVSLANWQVSEFAALGLMLALYFVGGLGIGWVEPGGGFLGRAVARRRPAR